MTTIMTWVAAIVILALFVPELFAVAYGVIAGLAQARKDREDR